MTEQDLRNQLYAAFKNRALMYYHIFNELRDELGEEKATAVMKRAIYKRGREIGRQFQKYGPADMQGLKDAFVAHVPDEGQMFAPEVQRCDAGGVDIKFHRCPLKEAYQEAGLSDEETAKMVEIAASVDYGTFEGAGFEFSADTWKPGREGCCHLHIRPGKK
ncbi:MAG: L-2-amino-thiazoline-4-carboxylic acid hydrolase [Desulfobacterales bacterium]|nr:MAG: L-2-amino-thiazoline-4-carboxylic acid hydrolase [Desulfobacterales bacterium]